MHPKYCHQFHFRRSCLSLPNLYLKNQNRNHLPHPLPRILFRSLCHSIHQQNHRKKYLLCCRQSHCQSWRNLRCLAQKKPGSVKSCLSQILSESILYQPMYLHCLQCHLMRNLRPVRSETGDFHRAFVMTLLPYLHQEMCKYVAGCSLPSQT